MTVTRIQELRSRDTIQMLRDLLERAEAGRLRGLAFAFKAGPHRHRYGFTGEYVTSPFEALGCLSRMDWRVNEMIEGYNGEPETRTMPL